MSRIRRRYEAQFRTLLAQAGTRRLDQGVQWLLNQAQSLSNAQEISLEDALRRVEAELDAKLAVRKNQPQAGARAVRFFCDSGLGGLARWLRGAGYEALWEAHIEDADLIGEARRLGVVILTTDSMMMERRVLRQGIVRAFWLPPTLRIEQQLALVFRHFQLAAGEPRCMSCGGELQRQDKEGLRERIPPRTYRWLDEYFVCQRCGKIFWHGTHWLRIRKAIEELKQSKR